MVSEKQRLQEKKLRERSKRLKIHTDTKTKRHKQEPKEIKNEKRERNEVTSLKEIETSKIEKRKRCSNFGSNTKEEIGRA